LFSAIRRVGCPLGDDDGIAIRVLKRELAAPVPIDLGSPLNGYLLGKRGVNGARIVGIDRNRSKAALVTLLRHVELEDCAVALKYDERWLVGRPGTARFEIQHCGIELYRTRKVSNRQTR